MSATPYADQWRADTRARIDRLALSTVAIGDRTGLGWRVVMAALHDDGQPLDFETASIIDEALRKLEDKAEARALRAGRLVPVAVDLNALLDCKVHFIDGRSFIDYSDER